MRTWAKSRNWRVDTGNEGYGTFYILTAKEDDKSDEESTGCPDRCGLRNEALTGMFLDFKRSPKAFLGPQGQA